MSKFKREDRYIIVKVSDLQEATKHLTNAHVSTFNNVLKEVERTRRVANKVPLECVVIESDWKCYETAWRLVEQECNEKTRDILLIEDLQKKLSEASQLNSSLCYQLDEIRKLLKM